MSATIAPKSDQLNADDLIGGPQTVTITGVTRGSPDQPVNVTTAEFGDGRPFKPCKSMRRVMVAAWGPDASTYIGRRMLLYRDESIRFGKEIVGGIRISAMSHIDRPLMVALTVTRGKRAPFTVEPLAETADAAIDVDVVADFKRRIAEATTASELDAIAADLRGCNLGHHRGHLRDSWADMRAAIEATYMSVAHVDDITRAGTLGGEDEQTAIDRSDEYTELFAIEEATDGGQERT